MESAKKEKLVNKEEETKKLLEWGLQARRDSNRLRNESSKYGLDKDKMVFGHLLSTIIGDDRNSFFYMHTFLTDEFSIRGNQQNAIERLNWEIETPETPANLRRKLKEVRENFLQSNWINKDSFMSSKNVWEKMREELEKETKKNLKMKEALEYFESNHGKIPPPQISN